MFNLFKWYMQKQDYSKAYKLQLKFMEQLLHNKDIFC